MAGADPHLYELRIYAIAPGRLPDMARRFRDDIRTLFPRHGIRIIGSWTALAGPQMPTFVYLMRWSGLEERSSAFASFVADPDWQSARTRTNGPSELVEHYEIQFLRALDSAGIAEPMALDEDELFELALHPAANGQAQAMRDALLEGELPARVRGGARVVGAFEAVTGPHLPSLVSLVRWPDATRWERAQVEMDEDGALSARVSADIAQRGRSVLGHADRYLMRPVDVSWHKA